MNLDTHLRYRMFGALPTLMYCGVRKYISIRAFLKPVSKSFILKTENMESFKAV